MRLLALALCLLACVQAGASDTVTDLQAALAGENRDDKLAALSAVGGAAKDKDEAVFNALIGAISDRQVGAEALNALRSRAGVSPKVGSRVLGPGYPGYPGSDSASDWGAWLAEWKKDKAQAAKLKKIEEDLKKKEAKPEAKPAEAKPEAKPAEEVAAAPPDDLGKLDRITFTDGGSLVCYIRTRRLDADGKLLSVRIVHANGAGEETIAASLITKIEDDIR